MDGVAVPVRDGSSLDGIHLLWYGEPAWGYSPHGFTILRRESRVARKLVCDRLEGRPLDLLHRGFIYQLPLALVRWRPAPCPEPLPPLRSEDVDTLEGFDPRTLHAEGRTTLRVARRDRALALERRDDDTNGGSPPRPLSHARFAVAAPQTPVTPTYGGCRRYRFDLSRPRDYVRLTFGTSGMLVIALNGERAIRAELVTGPGLCRFELSAPAITQLIVYTAGTRFIELCVEGDERKWGEGDDARVVAERLQLPVREINPEVTTPAEELALAKARMLQAPLITEPEFKQEAAYLRRLVAPRLWPPFERILLERERGDQGFMEFGLLPLALLPQIDGDGRRLLGLSYRDAKGLVAGRVYDYRVTGEFPEIDVKDRILSFRLVPGGTVLPASFYLEDVRLRLPAPTAVETRPTPGHLERVAVVRRGIPVAPAGGRPGLRLELSAPVRELTLELEPDAKATVRVRAISPGLAGLLGAADERTVPVAARVTLAWDREVERVELWGEVFFHGVRLHGVVGAARNPRRMLPVHLHLSGVRFTNTPPPPAPIELAVNNLQAPLLPVDPEVAVQQPPHNLGFRLTWRQPIEGAPLVWPSSESFAPPVGATGFVIERRRIDVPSAWETIGVRRAYGARLAKDGIAPLTADLDLMEHFGRKARGAAPDDFFTLDDVLVPPDAAEPPPPGSLWQYRIATVDLVGRRSATWMVSAVVRLEKRLPPPAPAPPAAAAPAGQAALRGVQARLIQRADPDISAAEKDAVLGAAHETAIRLSWSWPAALRAHDPWAREFRIYDRAQSGTVLTGRITSVTAAATDWECRVDWDRALGPDALAGLRVRSGGHSFRIDGHDAGGVGVTTRLRRLNLEPAAPPVTGPVELLTDTAGAEGRPALFDARVEVIPIVDGQTEYSSVLFDRFHVDAAAPRRTVWVGVSAADDQSYVADTLAEGRPGNESTIVTRTVSGRYHGQPLYVVPPPLAAVPERVTTEPEDSRVRVILPLPQLVRTAAGEAPLSGADRVQLERLAVSELSRRLSRDVAGVFRVAVPPDDAQAELALGNPDDREALRAQLASGQPGRIEGRFVREMLIQHPALGLLFVSVGGPVAFGDVPDTLPGQAERYLYRIRRADAAGHLSAAAALLDEIVRVPSLARPGTPEMEIGPTEDDHLRVGVSARDSFDLGWLALFWAGESLDGPASADVPVQLVRLKNRRDLLPDDGYRLRRGNAYLGPSARAVPGGDGVVRIDFDEVVGHGLRLRVWALALSRDGIASLVAGPRTATTARPPIAAPVPSVARANGRAVVSWDAPASEVEVRVELDDGLGEWRPVSGWLGPGVTQTERAVAGPAERYRLAARTTDGRRAVSDGVPVPGA